MRQFIPLSAFALMLLIEPAIGAVETYDGTERGFWEHRAVVVVRAEPGKVEEFSTAYSLHIVGVITTDPPVIGPLVARYRGGSNSALPGNWEPTKDGLHVLCLYLHPDDGWLVDNSYLEFFPDRRGLLAIEVSQGGPLPYRARDNLPFGKSWNTLKEPRTFSRWGATLPDVRVATTLELPYANAGGGTVTAESARAFGRGLGRAIKEYLSGDE